MGFVGSMLGTAGGAMGSGFSGPSSANILNPATVAQANTAYDQNQAALQQQNAFLQALQGQNGIQNQSNVFNQLQGVANGTGPNPAQAQLAQATGANVANQASLMAGQRGADQNVGLMARQAAQQGAATQQQAAGQAATMQANQSLGALQQLGGIAGQQVGQQQQAVAQNTQANQSEQSNILNAIAQQNSANVGMQSNVNSANASLIGQSMTNQANMLGNVVGGGASALGLLGAEGGKVPHFDEGGGVEAPAMSYSTPDPTPFHFDPSAGKLSGSSGGSSGGGKSGGGLGLLALLKDGGQVQQFADGTATPISMTSNQFDTLQPSPSAPSATPPPGSKSGPQSNVGKHFAGPKNYSGPAGTPLSGASLTGYTIGQGLGTALKSIFGGSSAPADVSGQQPADNSNLGSTDEAVADNSDTAPSDSDSDSTSEATAAKGGKVPALLSPGERYLSPQKVSKVMSGKADPISDGKKVPGKPRVSGAKNSYANDTVKANLDEGGIVIPRSVTQGKNPYEDAMKFVHATLARDKKIPMKAIKK